MSMFIHDEFIRLIRTYVEENAMTEETETHYVEAEDHVDTETCYSAGDMADQGAKQYRAGYAEGLKDMRETCAKVCDDIQAKSYLSVARSCANAIRDLPITEGEQ